jgi:hypothetical protein
MEAPAGPTQPSLATRSPGGGAPSGVPGTADDAGQSAKRRKSPVGSPINQPRPRSTSPLPRRSRARQQQSTDTRDPDFLRREPQPKKLWNPEEGSSASPHPTRPHSSRQSRTSASAPSKRANTEDEVEDPIEAQRLLKEPETRPISHEQLVAEVKGIYAGLMMVESKCIEVDNAQSSQSESKLNNEQWQALIALHRTLLHEHHDFFLASQHPSASQALKRLASKYAMPARMWRHGIHSFLELLRHRLPGSLEHMLTFIYLAYSMMALLYETVPAFEDTWIECLGDLGRYRMAIEDEDIRDREVWTSVSRQWYKKASDKAPTTGRLYHHLAILARPNALQQLFYYTKALCVPIPFASAKESIMTLFDPILGAGSYQHGRLVSTDVAFVKAHGILFSHKHMEKFGPVVDEFLGSLDDHISQMKGLWIEAGYFIAIANCCALLSYGREENLIIKSISNQSEEKQDQDVGSVHDSPKPSKDFENALDLAMGTHEVVFGRPDDPNALPYFHVVMVFMSYLTRFPTALRQLESRFPWKLTSFMLNNFLDSGEDFGRFRGNQFPRESNVPHPLPEDYALRGLLFSEQLFPEDWFSNQKIDDDEKYFEKPSMANIRKERILWLGHKIAQSGSGLIYDEVANRFTVYPEPEKDIEEMSKDADMMDILGASQAASQTSNNPSLETSAGEAMAVDEVPATTPGAPVV